MVPVYGGVTHPTISERWANLTNQFPLRFCFFCSFFSTTCSESIRFCYEVIARNTNFDDGMNQNLKLNEKLRSCHISVVELARRDVASPPKTAKQYVY